MNNFQYLQETRQSIKVTIDRTCKGGWICSYKSEELFLPGSQLYKEVNDYENCVGKTVTVLVQRADQNGVVVSHKDYIRNFFERKRILQELAYGKQLSGIVKGKKSNGYFISVLGIIGFMPNSTIVDCRELHYGQSLEFAVLKSDQEKSLLILSEKLLLDITKRKTKLQHIGDLNNGDEIKGRILKLTTAGYIVELNNNITGFLKFDDIPTKNKYEVNDEIAALISNIDIKTGNISLSVKKLIDFKWSNLELFIKSKIIPGHTEIVGRVVYLERNLVTLYFNYEGEIFYGYIKNEDLAWEKVLNAADIVFLGEELVVHYLYTDNRRLFFDLKWQQKDLYPSSLFKLDTDELLSTLDIYKNKFVGLVSISYNLDKKTGEKAISNAFVSNLMSWGANNDERILVDKFVGTNIIALVPIRYAYGLTNGKYYIFKLRAAALEKRLKEHRPYMFSAELYGSAIPVDNPYKSLVEKSFKENKTPKSNRESASYLKEIGADMYTDRDRMFYELLQNADDASSNKGVRIMVQIQDNYLIFSHDGFSFSRQDFRSIVSTANSTKRLDRKKTGYKGIGFKSVFTDSEKVYIKTGGFFFVFDKNAELFNDFRAFYKYVNPLYTEEQLQIFFAENQEYEDEFEKVDHLPWQLLPFWVDECPEALRGTSFMRNCNVAIALKMDATADKYRDLIKGIIQKPRFMLFLRNTQRIQFEDKKWEILSIAKQTDLNSDVVRLKNSFANTNEEVSYIVKEGCEIQVSNDNFETCCIPIKKECKLISGREKWYMYQIVDGVDIPITSIPERIIAADTTTLSYAFMLDNNGSVTPIPNRTPSLYAYLPMEDRRYLFPFFINADFELSSNRQEAKKVSVWNEFLFYNIGKNIVSWIATLAKKEHSSYLKILPTDFFIEILEEGKSDRLAAQFNRGYKEALLHTPFLLNDKGNVVSQDEIIIDESGFSKVVGCDDFCYLWNLNKRLLSPNIDDEPLSNTEMFTKIEHLQSCDVISKIIDKSTRYKLLYYWCNISDSKRQDILKHIVAMPRNRKNLSDYFKDIPAYSCGNRHFSFNRLLSSSNYLLKLTDLAPVFEFLEKLGFNLTDLEESKHPFHEDLKDDIEAYKLHVFEAVSQKTSQNASALTALEKVNLFKHFANTKYGLKPEQLSDWKIFNNQEGTITSLGELTHIDSSLYGGITRKFVIDENDYDYAPKLLGHYMMKEKNQYDNVVISHWEEFTKEVGSSEDLALCLYKLAATTYIVAEHEQAEEKDIRIPQSMPIVFANGQMRYLSDVFISNKISNDANIKAIVEYLSDKHVPSQIVTKALKGKPFDCKCQTLEHLCLVNNKSVTQEQLLELLSYCIDNNDTVFKKYYIQKQEENFVFTALLNNDVVAFTNNQVLKEFINNNCSTIKLLPTELSSFTKVKEIISDDDLLLKVIESIKVVDNHLMTLLSVCKDSISAVKHSFMAHLSQIKLNEQSFSNDNDLNLQILKVASTIEKIDDSFFDVIRKKIYISVFGSQIKLTDIKTQHTVEIADIKYPLSRLLPNEDNIAKVIDTLKDRIEDAISSTFAEKLFGNEVDAGRATSVFEELNKKNTILENGVQLAFVLEYARTNNVLRQIQCQVYDNTIDSVGSELCDYWLVHGQSFIDDNYVLSSKYADVSRYITIPYSLPDVQCFIKDNVVDYQYIKQVLNEDEAKDLLSYIYNNTNIGMALSDEGISTIRNSLNLSDKYYVLSPEYSLENEQIPQIVENWRKLKDPDNRSKFLIKTFGFFGAESDAVRIRKYLDGKCERLEVKPCRTLSKLTCTWINSKELILSDGQYAVLQDILSEEDYDADINFEQIKVELSSCKPYMSFGDYSVYLYTSKIPWKVFVKGSNYIFHKYFEEDIAIKGYDIYVNENCLSELQSLIQSIVNTCGFTADDFMKFLETYQSMISGTFEGENDNDIDEEARLAANELARQEALSWLSAMGYNIDNATSDFSIISGVQKGSKVYHIVVKSFRSKKQELKINPNEWLELLKDNARLMLYLGHMSFAVIDRKTLLGNHDFLRLRIASSNFSLDNRKLDYTISQLAENIQMFERTHFVFEHVNESILKRADSLDGYGLYKSNSDEAFTAGSEDDL